MNRSESLLERALNVIPGGVNSPVRAFKAVGGNPKFIKRAQGAFLEDVDGKRYLDFVCSWGAIILGHGHHIVQDAVLAALQDGASFGAPTEKEVLLAELICHLYPGMDMVRLVNSGTEATMSAVRLARAYTNRELIMKFDGCYHGHGDSFLVSAGSGLATFGISTSPGVLRTTAAQTLSVEYNSLSQVKDLLVQYVDGQRVEEKLAAIIVEPIAGNMGMVLPDPGFLTGLRQVCDDCGALLIFDEVMTGFRVDRGGAAGIYQILPDLVTLGKVMGGGLPIGAFGGRSQIMSLLAPEGPVYQAGTLSGNPLAVSAGLAVLSFLEKGGQYKELDDLSSMLIEGLTSISRTKSLPLVGISLGGMFGFYFSEHPVMNYTEAKNADSQLFSRFFKGMIDEGVYLAPSPFEAGFITLDHTPQDISYILDAASVVLSRI